MFSGLYLVNFSRDDVMTGTLPALLALCTLGQGDWNMSKSIVCMINYEMLFEKKQQKKNKQKQTNKQTKELSTKQNRAYFFNLHIVWASGGSIQLSSHTSIWIYDATY